MKVYALWHGGPNYRPGEYRDIEEYGSLRAAKSAFESRAGFDPYYPCVEDSEMWLWRKNKPVDDGDLYPGSILRMGPRGGVREEPA